MGRQQMMTNITTKVDMSSSILQQHVFFIKKIQKSDVRFQQQWK
jgi:hypothetical protein